MSCLSYLQLYQSKNCLVFDNIKGILIYTLLYKSKKINLYRKDESQYFDVLKYTSNCDIKYFSEGNELFDTVFVAGKFDNFLEKFKKNIGNIVLFYFYLREEAFCVFEELLKDEDFIDVSIMDFFKREWQILENVRPMMNCDMRSGFIVRATRIFR
ncbi:hypothetical protein GVAV_000760 [Gurleya vavrai]